jgi:hypothetical protein
MITLLGVGQGQGVSAVLPQSCRSFNSLIIGRKSYPQTNLHSRGNRAGGRVTFVEERGGSTTPTTNRRRYVQRLHTQPQYIPTAVFGVQISRSPYRKNEIVGPHIGQRRNAPTRQLAHSSSRFRGEHAKAPEGPTCTPTPLMRRHAAAKLPKCPLQKSLRIEYSHYQGDGATHHHSA